MCVRVGQGNGVTLLNEKQRLRLNFFSVNANIVGKAALGSLPHCSGKTPRVVSYSKPLFIEVFSLCKSLFLGLANVGRY